MIDPVTAAPARKPLTADVRSGYRSPPMAMIIGKTGPVAKPANANSAIESSTDGAKIAPMSATEVAAEAAAVNRTWSKRSASRDETSRPSVRPAQKSDSAVVATLNGAGSRKRTSQFETPTSDAT